MRENTGNNFKQQEQSGYYFSAGAKLGMQKKKQCHFVNFVLVGLRVTAEFVFI